MKRLAIAAAFVLAACTTSAPAPDAAVDAAPNSPPVDSDAFGKIGHVTADENVSVWLARDGHSVVGADGPLKIHRPPGGAAVRALSDCPDGWFIKSSSPAGHV